ncbi:GTP-dependent zinc transferase RNJ42_03150 [Nakaseomyces bracarensis]|uniref:GTP-dependent zinc transferase n=1 Tax=Nakaseomyces bracarensis TaxID=273131 RepID=UPI0038726F55
MSALKNYRYNEEEDGELPPLVTGKEANLSEILKNVKNDGGVNIVSEDKVARTNKQTDGVSRAVNMERKRIPVTIITGYLGSGKSTLLEKIALKGSDRKIAVILNEFGDSSEIEKAMTIRNGEANYQEWLDLGNGCLCCSLKNVGVKAIEDMIERSPGMIDYILLETSGIADPAPIAKMFWQDEGLNSNVYIDGIITVLDAEHIEKCLDDVSPEAHWHNQSVIKEENLTIAYFQMAMADRIILNKYDKIENEPNMVKRIEGRIKDINSIAPIFGTKYGEIELHHLLDLHAYDSTDITIHDEFKEKILKTDGAMHDHRMSTVALSFRKLKNQTEFERLQKEFLQKILWKNFGLNDDEDVQNLKNISSKWEVERSKGLFIVENTDQSDKARDIYVMQGVRDTFDIFEGHETEAQECKLVLIGKYLDEEGIRELLYKVLDK